MVQVVVDVIPVVNTAIVVVLDDTDIIVGLAFVIVPFVDALTAVVVVVAIITIVISTVAVATVPNLAAAVFDLFAQVCWFMDC